MVACMLVATASTSAADERPAAPVPSPSLMLPPLVPGTTRVEGTVRPFFNVLGPGGGVFTDLAVEHYFLRPWKAGVELSPFVLVGTGDHLGVISHVRLRGAFASDYVEIGLGIGARLQRYGPSGWSVAPALRLGSLDGLNLRMEVGSSLIRNYYTGRAQFALSHVLGGIDVPVARRLAVTLDGGYGIGLWMYGTLGLQQVVMGNGGPGTLRVGAGFGLVWAIDRFPCQYGDITPCTGAAWGVGPTLSIRVDRRF